VSDTTHIEEREHPTPSTTAVRPDLTPPPSSPEPDHEALRAGLDRLEAVKPY
jgi:hypothetical protein